MKVTLTLPAAGAPLRAAQHVATQTFAERNGLEVVAGPSGAVVVTGAPERLAQAFGTTLATVDHPLGSFRTHRQPLSIPLELRGLVAGAIGLDETPATISRLLHTRGMPPLVKAAGGRATPRTPPITVQRLVEHYNLPAALDGSGQRIAVIALGGGFHESDIDAFFARAGRPRPKIRSISIEGVSNAPLAMETLSAVVKTYDEPGMSLRQLHDRFPDTLADAVTTVETTMDVEVAAAVAPGAEIDVYFTPNSARGLYEAILAAIGDLDSGGAVQRPPAALSFSWGWPEEYLSGESAAQLNQALWRASMRGVCICAASGDSGSLGLADDDLAGDAASVLFPASSPWVLACGGTQLHIAHGKLGAESAWNDVERGVQQATGGGVSGAFTLPPWQVRARVPVRGSLNGAAWIAPSVPPTERQAYVGRGVPDVAAYAAQMPGYELVVGGHVCGAGGTSAATPFWAGLVARLAQRIGPSVRWLPQIIYDPSVASTFRPIASGTNAMKGASSAASYAARGGWSACCGLGTPDGTRLLDALERRLGMTSA